MAADQSELNQEPPAVEEDDYIILEDDEAEKYLDYLAATAGKGSEGDMNIDNEDSESVESMDADEAGPSVPCEPSRFTLLAHQGSVFCVCLDPRCEFIVSGGEDDRAIVWTFENAQLVCSLPGHKESVTHIVFNKNGDLLATGDLGGNIQVWSRKEFAKALEQSAGGSNNETAVIEPVWSESIQEELQWMHWYPHGNATTILLAGSGDGDGSVGIWLIADANKSNARYLPGIDGSACISGHNLNGNPQQLYTLYASGQLRCWNIRENRPEDSGTQLSQWVGSAHQQSEEEDAVAAPVIMATSLKNDDLLAVGYSNGFLLIVTPLRKQCVFNYRSKDRDSIEGLAFSSSHPYVAFATVNGEIGVVDISTQKMRYSWTQTHETETVGVTCLEWIENAPIFLTGNVDGSLAVWDALKPPTEALLRRIQIHSATILDLKLITHDDQLFLCTASDDASVCVNVLEF